MVLFYLMENALFESEMVPTGWWSVASSAILGIPENFRLLGGSEVGVYFGKVYVVPGPFPSPSPVYHEVKITTCPGHHEALSKSASEVQRPGTKHKGLPQRRKESRLSFRQVRGQMPKERCQADSWRFE